MKKILKFILWSILCLVTGLIGGAFGGVFLTLIFGAEYPRKLNDITRSLHMELHRNEKDNVTEFRKPEKDKVAMGFH